MVLLEHERAELLAPTFAFIGQMPDNAREALALEIFAVFDAWKAEKTDDSGNVDAYRSEGPGLLLGGGYKPVKIPADDAEPWETADEWTHDNISLAFYLLLNGFQPFFDLILAKGIGTTFSMVALLDWKTAQPSSVIRINAFLCRMLVAELETARKGQGGTKGASHKAKTKAEAIRNRVEAKQANQKTRETLWVALASQYVSRRDDAKLSDTLAYVREEVRRKHGAQYLRAEATMEKVISRARLFRPNSKP